MHITVPCSLHTLVWSRSWPGHLSDLPRTPPLSPAIYTVQIQEFTLHMTQTQSQSQHNTTHKIHFTKKAISQSLHGQQGGGEKKRGRGSKSQQLSPTQPTKTSTFWGRKVFGGDWRGMLLSLHFILPLFGFLTSIKISFLFFFLFSLAFLLLQYNNE